MYLPLEDPGQRIENAGRLPLLTQHLKEARILLEEQGLPKSKAKTYLAPLEELRESFHEVDTRNFKGIACFLQGDQFFSFSVPVALAPTVYVGNQVYLKPLLQLPTQKHTFFLLRLSLDKVALYKGNSYEWEELTPHPEIPQSLEEVVGKDYQEKVLQARSGQSGQGASIFHGHGEGKDDRKGEIQKYCRAISKGVERVLHAEHAPLVVDAVPYIFDMYASVNSYQEFWSQPLSQPLNGRSTGEIQHFIGEELRTFFEQDREKKKQQYKDQIHTERTAHVFPEILTAASLGRVDTLFLPEDKEIWGNYQTKMGGIPTTDAPVVGLYNTAAMLTLQKGGDVYVMPAEELPETASEVCALMRY